MAQRIPQTFIQEVLNQINIVDLISKRIRLKKAGARFTACCPFHQEKTPSFHIDPIKQFYYCFGCHAHGNAISFLMNYDHLTFMEAIENLTSSLGLTLPTDNSNPEQFKKYNELHDLMQKAALFYQKTLQATPEAKQYINQRGISEKTQTLFELGFAPNRWDALSQKLKGQPKLIQGLKETGMLCEKKQSETYDRFRNRLMFPIKNSKGKIIGFGGRSIDEQMPKYLNSPETILFHKGQELYGLNLLKKPKKLLVVEGYMDVIGLYEHGVDFAVAPLGTAITKKQIQTLTRYSQEIIFCFDADSAGQKAAWRSLETLLPMMKDGLSAYFLTLPAEEDPDSFIRKKGLEVFNQTLEEALPLETFFFSNLSKPFDLEKIHGKTQFAEAAKPYLNNLPNGLFKQLMTEKLAEIIEVSQEQLTSHEEPPRRSSEMAPPPASYPKKTSFHNRKNKKAPSAMRTAISLLTQNPNLIENTPNLDLIKNAQLPGMELLKELLEIIKRHPGLSTGALLEHFREKPNEQKQLAKLAFDTQLTPKEGVLEEFSGAIKCIQQQGIQSTIDQLINQSKSKELSSEEKNMLQQLIAYKMAEKQN